MKGAGAEMPEGHATLFREDGMSPLRTSVCEDVQRTADMLCIMGDNSPLALVSVIGANYYSCLLQRLPAYESTSGIRVLSRNHTGTLDGFGYTLLNGNRQFVQVGHLVTGSEQFAERVLNLLGIMTVHIKAAVETVTPKTDIPEMMLMA